MATCSWKADVQYCDISIVSTDRTYGFIMTLFNPQRWRRGRRLMHPLGFSKIAERRRREAPFSTLWGILCLTFDKKKNDRIMLGHGAMPSLRGQAQAIFLREMAGYCTLEGDIDHNEVSLDHFRSKLICLTPSQYPLTFRSRSDQGQVQG